MVEIKKVAEKSLKQWLKAKVAEKSENQRLKGKKLLKNLKTLFMKNYISFVEKVRFSEQIVNFFLISYSELRRV